MAKYAIRIQGEAHDLLTYLNGGVQPATQETPTFLVVDTDRLLTPHEIVTEEQLLNDFVAHWSTTIWHVE